MGYLKEKVAYISGLMAGMDYSQSTNEGKLFNAMLELLDEMALSIEEHDEMLDDVGDCLEGFQEDIELLEDEVYGYEEDEADEYCIEEYNEDGDYEDLSSIKCDECGDNIYFDPELVKNASELLCPGCSAKVPFEK